jgi:hypothetical protein
VVSGKRGQAEEALKMHTVLLEQKLWATKIIRHELDYTSNITEHLYDSVCLL